MEEKIKIYIRGKNKIYIFFNDEIYFFENQELESVLETFFEENQVEKNTKVAVILHFSYFFFENFSGNVEINDDNLNKKNLKIENILEIFKKKINFLNKKMVISYLENKFLDIYLDKREIVKVKNCVKKYSAVVSEVKIDFEAVYSYYKNGNFEIDKNEKFIYENSFLGTEKNFQNNFQTMIGDTEGVQEIKAVRSEDTNKNWNFGEIEEIDISEEIDGNQDFGEKIEMRESENGKIEILQIGEESSVRILIEDDKIVELEKIELKIDDVDDIENFDFGDMIIVGTSENDIKAIFMGTELSDSLDFAKTETVFDKEGLKSIKISDVVIAGIIIITYFIGYNSIPLEKRTVENEIIQKEIKKMEKNYLKEKSEEIPDYSKELATLREIDEGIKRREYYSVIKFLVENSKNGVDYTKINYENAKWTVQGEMENFNNFERFENNILRKYPNSELGYLKDNETATVFEYIFESF